MFRREVFESVGGCDPALPYGEDYDLWLKIASRFEIKHIPDNLVLMAYHDHASGLSDDDRRLRSRALNYTRKKSQEIRAKYIHRILEKDNA
jgi:hypothetical protein